MLRGLMRDRHEGEMAYWWGSLEAIFWIPLGRMPSLVNPHHIHVCNFLVLPTSYLHQGTLGGLSLNTGDLCPGLHREGHDRMGLASRYHICSGLSLLWNSSRLSVPRELSNSPLALGCPWSPCLVISFGP